MSQDAVVVVGFSELSWPIFQAVIWWMMGTLPFISTLSTILDVDYFHKHVKGVLELSVRSNSPVIGLIEMMKWAMCSDPKDGVYAIMSMYESNVKISPDYLKTKEEVYEDFTRAIITEFELIDILSLAELQNSSPILPSWAPDLSVLRHTNLISAGRSSGNSKHRGYFSAFNEALHVESVAVDTVKCLAQPYLIPPSCPKFWLSVVPGNHRGS